MADITISVPTDNAHARMQLAAQLTIAAASLMPRVKDCNEAIDASFALYSRIDEHIRSAERTAADPKEDNP